MSEAATNPAREPLDRAFRLMALGYAVRLVAEMIEELTPKSRPRRQDADMELCHLGDAIAEEASNLAEELHEAGRD
jgi:hypothetical protein